MTSDVFSRDLEAKGTSKIPSSIHPNVLRHFAAAPRHHRLSTSDSDWCDWRWQQRNRITDLSALEPLVTLTDEERSGVQSLGQFRMAVTPYYASLIDGNNPACPIRRQAIPLSKEAERLEEDLEDPLSEERDMPVPGLTHRYPHKVLLYLSHNCPVYCRFCTRKRKVSDASAVRIDASYFEAALNYIRANPQIRDVVLSGGDPLTFSDASLKSLIARLRDITTIEVIRLGTRNLVTLPYRVTTEFANMLRPYQPIYINTHFNHPIECTMEALEACLILSEAGCVIRNQMVLLKGINDDPATVLRLNQLLLLMRVVPYYIYQCDLAEGIGHFRTSVETGLRIMEHLWRYASGMAIPHFVIDAPGGGGKVPILPQRWWVEGNRVGLKNFQDRVFYYVQP
jgi:lysine 2,3-aminomutase